MQDKNPSPQVHFLPSATMDGQKTHVNYSLHDLDCQFLSYPQRVNTALMFKQPQFHLGGSDFHLWWFHPKGGKAAFKPPAPFQEAKAVDVLSHSLYVQRFNVAVTRPKALLIVIGSPTILKQDPFWGG